MTGPSPCGPMTGSMQRNKTFGSIGGGAPPSFMQHGGNSSTNIATTYMQNKLMRSKQQQAMQQPMGSNFAMKSSHPGNLDFTMNDENNMHPVRLRDNNITTRLCFVRILTSLYNESLFPSLY